MNFNQIFDTKNRDEKNKPRDKFLSRVFGIFNEEIVRIWCNSKLSPYSDAGRPTVYEKGMKERGSTLDFTLQDKKTGKNYVSEMKCEIQYQNFKYLKLNGAKQLEHHNKTAFKRFLGVAQNPHDYLVKVGGEEISVDGSILIWGKIDKDSVEKICKSTGISKLLSMEDIINDLIKAKNKKYLELIDQKKEWINYLLDELKSVP